MEHDECWAIVNQNVCGRCIVHISIFTIILFSYMSLFSPRCCMEHDECWAIANQNVCGWWSSPSYNIYDYTCHKNGDVTCRKYIFVLHIRFQFIIYLKISFMLPNPFSLKSNVVYSS